MDVLPMGTNNIPPGCEVFSGLATSLPLQKKREHEKVDMDSRDIFLHNNGTGSKLWQQLRQINLSEPGRQHAAITYRNAAQNCAR
jgi:hypothetical protein